MTRKTLLVIGAGLEAVPGIELARQMGLRVVASDMNPQAPGFAVADDCLIASTYDVEATVEAACRYHRQHPLAGVLCIATDVPHTVAAVAHALNLPGIPLDSARLAVDKLAMKECFYQASLPVPWFCQISSEAELREVIAARGLPLVIKPVDSRGARGVLRLTETVDSAWAFGYARSFSPSGRVMVEEYLNGPQVSTESLVVDGVAHTPGFSDRNYEFLERYAPHIIENGGELPSFLDASIQQAVMDLVGHAARAMGIANGVVKGDIVVHQGKPAIIELADRLSGGYFCTHEIPLNTGVDLVGAAIRLAIGEKPTADQLTPRFQKGVAQRYLFPAPGIVRAVEGEKEAREMEGIALCEVRVKPGDRVSPVDSHPARAGVVIAVGRDREEAKFRVERAIRTISIRTE